MEALISSLSRQEAVAINHTSDVSAARRHGQRLAESLGFDETRAGQLAIVITEAATNIVKHAGQGMLYIGVAQTAAAAGVDVVAVDDGPGIADIASSLVDGVSTAGTSGTGLGALRRLSDEFDCYTAHGKGAAFYMRLWRGEAPPPRPVVTGALALPLAGEEKCGDGWGVACHEHGATLLAADGLGHGPDAARAADAAVATLDQHRGLEPAELMERIHSALRITRGAAAAVARIDCTRDQLRFAGIGNISACVYDHNGRRALVSHNGIVGHNMRKVQEFTVACPPGALCIMHSDGLQTQWDLDSYPGLGQRHPALVSAVLMRDFIRRRDDAMVLAVRRSEQP
jgi:anti-sigma regulatory factor (Ser/Thr protein kinase)